MAAPPASEVGLPCAKQLADRAVADTAGTMDDVSILLSRLALGLPFAFTHFMDGEIGALTWRPPGKHNCTIWCFLKTTNCTAQATPNLNQVYSAELQGAIGRAMRTEHPLLYAGVPCTQVQRGIARKVLRVIPDPFRHRTLGALFHDGNYGGLCHILALLLRRRAVRGSGIHLVVSEGADAKRFTAQLRLPPLRSVLRVPHKSSFRAYTGLANAMSGFAAGDIVILCCGMLGRILATAWVHQQPTVTFLEVGSHFNPALYGRVTRWLPHVKLAYHRDANFTTGGGLGCAARLDLRANLKWLETCVVAAEGTPSPRTSCPPGHM